jgi:hypothetical protein
VPRSRGGVLALWDLLAIPDDQERWGRETWLGVVVSLRSVPRLIAVLPAGVVKWGQRQNLRAPVRFALCAPVCQIGRGAGACLVWRPLLLTLFEVGRLGSTAPLGWHSSAWARVSAPQERAAEQGVAMPQSSVRLHSRLEALSCVPSIGGCSTACGLRRMVSRGSASLAPCVTPCVCHLEMGAHPYRAGMFPMLNRFQVVGGLGEHRPFGL